MKKIQLHEKMTRINAWILGPGKKITLGSENQLNVLPRVRGATRGTVSERRNAPAFTSSFYYNLEAITN